MRPALRIAARDALQHRARSVLVLVMIALPVLAVTAAAILIVTIDVSGPEALDRRLGTAAQARVTATAMSELAQAPDPEYGAFSGGGEERTPATLRDVEQVLGDRPALEYREGSTRVQTSRGVAEVPVTEIDLRSPLAAGFTRLDAGRLPEASDEAVISPALADRGVGDTLTLADGRTLRVVGVVTSTAYRVQEQAWAPLGGFGLEGTIQTGGDGTSWLVGGAPVDWAQVRRLNDEGVSVLSRAVLADPPPPSQVDESVRDDSGGGLDSATIAVVGLVVAMALLEVVLLAGPAFAVGARRQSRTLALIAASGGTPRQARRVILASGVVLGATAALAGTVLGFGVSVVALPVAQRFSNEWFGPYEVPWLAVLGIAVFGLVSALLASVVPAWLASRQDVVAVLAGRRGDRPPSVRSPILGLVLLAAGVAGAAGGSQGIGSENTIALSALIAVLGMILVIPVVVNLVARLGRRLPLPLRYAVRDAARHRTRTVPAVAAVAATVAGVVALGIANASDAAQNEGTYAAQLPRGDAVVRLAGSTPAVAGQLVATARRTVPQADATTVRGIPQDVDGGYRDLLFALPGQEDGTLPQSWSTSLGSSVLVADRTPSVLADLTGAQRTRASAVLAQGGAVVLTSGPVTGSSVRVRAEAYDDQGETVGRPAAATVPAYFVRWPTDTAPAAAVVAPAVAQRLRMPVADVGLLLSGTTITAAQEKDLTEAVGALAVGENVYVERGYQPDPAQRAILWVLGALGAVLMLGGTLTATFLALSDARPDLATLSAVGATPRTRRGVAAAYAVVIGLVGAVLGAAVGFVPGVAVSYPLTDTSWSDVPGRAAHYLDIPWTFIGVLVVALPLLTALLVGLTARSRLPLVARLD